MSDPTDKWAEFHAKAEEFGSSSDAIEYLIDEIVELRAALQPFARLYEALSDSRKAKPHSELWGFNDETLTVADFAGAAAALECS
jgi:hypothetical protein